jgi:hypothetical protein
MINLRVPCVRVSGLAMFTSSDSGEEIKNRREQCQKYEREIRYPCTSTPRSWQRVLCLEETTVCGNDLKRQHEETHQTGQQKSDEDNYAQIAF